MNDLESARAKRRKKETLPSREPDVTFSLWLRPSSTERIEWLSAQTSGAVKELHAHDWEGARRIGKLIHSSWWHWMNWKDEDFPESWRTNTVVSLTWDRHAWLLKQDLELADEERKGTFVERWRFCYWFLRGWWAITMSQLRWLSSILFKTKE